MPKLSMRVTTTLLFLKSSIKDFYKIYDMTEKCMNELTGLKVDTVGYSGRIRTISNKYRKKLNDMIEEVIFDYRLFNIDIDELSKNKNEPDVLYSISKYMSVIDEYKKIYKKSQDLYERCETKKEEASRKENYSLYIGINKTDVYINKVNYMSEKIMNKLKKLIDDTLEE